MGWDNMTTNEWGLLLGLGLLFGATAGAWVALRVARLRHKRKLQRATDGLRQQSAALADQLRGAQARADSELAQLRQSHKRQMAAFDAEPQAAVARAEQRLNAAYAEIDRLRRQLGGADVPTEPAELAHGFAATRPMPRNL